jgi:putative SOS response-associated peptidase YedK
MPIVLGRGAFDGWLAPDVTTEDLVPLMTPDHVDLEVMAVGPSVNSVKNDDPRCLEPGEVMPPRQASLF